MSRFAFARSTPAALFFLLVGCTGPVDDATGTSEGAATTAPAAAGPTQAITAGNYHGHMPRAWDGALAIAKASAEKLDFELEISPDLDVAPIGRLRGTAKLRDGRYRYDDGSCTIDFEHVTDKPGAQRGDLFVNASIACGVMLGIDGHTTGSTAFDLTATWQRD